MSVSCLDCDKIGTFFIFLFFFSSFHFFISSNINCHHYHCYFLHKVKKCKHRLKNMLNKAFAAVKGGNFFLIICPQPVFHCCRNIINIENINSFHYSFYLEGKNAKYVSVTAAKMQTLDAHWLFAPVRNKEQNTIRGSETPVSAQ